MSHNINEERMFYYGETPWHGVGTELKQPATAREAIEAARLDYKVQLHPVMTDFKVINNVMATARHDNQDVLGIVSPKYRIIQNTEAFSFFDGVVGEGQAIYHTAGALGKGERIWIMAKLPNDIVIKDDVIEKYLVLTNSHDGKSALKMYFTPIRVVCQNTLSMSLVDASGGISIRHSGNIKSKTEEAQRLLQIAGHSYKDFEDKTRLLTDTPLNVDKAERYFNRLIYNTETPTREDFESTKTLNKRNELLGLFESGLGNKNHLIRHTAWTAYNAVTEYVDHRASIRNVMKNPSNRIKNIWFGAGAKIKQRAFVEALNLCEVN